MNGSDEVGDEPKKRVDANAPTDRTIDDELEDPFEDPALVTHVSIPRYNVAGFARKFCVDACCERKS
ncbi:hypothetical protein RB195_020738 [Necator americanus]|uniref:Uncharacterized protein n=1 Tax=Necator americanus TaxID=51031 RepID=A0ABR1CMB4_NECAM